MSVVRTTRKTSVLRQTFSRGHWTYNSDTAVCLAAVLIIFHSSKTSEGKKVATFKLQTHWWPFPMNDHFLMNTVKCLFKLVFGF
jgi:hypothetical protein